MEIAGVVILVIIAGLFFNREKKIFCAWCGSKKVKFVSGEAGNFFWEYRKKDGSQDKSVNDNYQQASYASIWSCPTCTAITTGNHFVEKIPSQKSRLHDVILTKMGNGERASSNWESLDSVYMKTKSANRNSKC